MRPERSNSPSLPSSTFGIVLLDDTAFASTARIGAARSLSLMGQCLLMALAQACACSPPHLMLVAMLHLRLCLCWRAYFAELTHIGSLHMFTVCRTLCRCRCTTSERLTTPSCALCWTRSSRSSGTAWSWSCSERVIVTAGLPCHLVRAHDRPRSLSKMHTRHNQAMSHRSRISGASSTAG